MPELWLRTRTKVIIGLLGVLLIAGVATILFLRFQLTKSFPQVTGSVVLPGLEHSVTILRDEFGVPRIEAAGEHDLMFALGYVHAQDRLWQMDMVRRVGEGRLSEVFGSVALPFDRMFRIIGIHRISKEIEQKITGESHNRLVAYAQGVNAFIDTHHGKYPVEFDMLGYDPESWIPVHSIIVGRLMAWELNLSWWTDLTYGEIAARVPLEKAIDIFPPYPGNIPPTVPSAEWHRYTGLGKEFMRAAQEYAAFNGNSGMLGGSNAWAVGPGKSAPGKVILANDTHLQLQTPAKWYEVVLHAPGYDVRGMSVPGVPGIVAGNNQHIAWGITNVMADDADFYIEQIDSTDTTRYWYDGGWLPIRFREEEIMVKGDTIVPLIIRSTHHGPIITDVGTVIKKHRVAAVASMRWTGAEISDQIGAFNKINRATNWEEFTQGVSQFSGPGQNFVYGDASGNIGYWCGVKLPIRGKQNTTLPLPGWDPSTEWKGFVPFKELPHLYNPPEGYIATANNKIVDDSYPYHISDLWEPPARIVRLRDVLGTPGAFSVEDFARLQSDTFSPFAKALTPYILAACSDSGSTFPERDLVLEYFRNWNFEFTREDVTTTIFQEFFVKLLENTYRDELGEDLFHDWTLLVNVPIRVTMKLVEEGTSTWFDDLHTDSIETRDLIIRKSMNEAVTTLRERFGGQLKTWRWGDLHSVTLRHPFGLVKPLDRIFNIGPFPYPGGSTSLMSGEYDINKPFAVTVGPSFRQIIDFSNLNEVRSVLPSGQSGQVFNIHYDDQTPLWLNGGYRIARMTPAGGREWDRLILKPGL